MTRLDVRTADYTGFVILDEAGKPIQAMYRRFTCEFNGGSDNGRYWLAPATMPTDVFNFVVYATILHNGS